MSTSARETDPEPMVITLRHGTVGRFSDGVSMGVVEIGAGTATVQFLDGGEPVTLVTGRAVRHADVQVTLLDATPAPDLRLSQLVIQVVVAHTQALA